MKPPAVTREDLNRFALAGFLPGYLRLLIFPRWTSYKCPHCGHVFRRDFWPENVRLGPGQRACSRCRTLFDDGSREWPKLTSFEKSRFFFPPLLIGVSGGLFLAGIVVSVLPQRDRDSRVTVIGLAFVLIPLLLWSFVRLPWVLRSIRRYNGRPPSL